jgi:hypothetical protein
MASLPRTPPLTPLDTLRALLGEYADGDTGFSARLTHLLHGMKKQAVGELGRRLAPSVSSRGLRKAIIALVTRFDWPEWAPHLEAALLQEPDLGVFDEGCAALGILGTRHALEALRHLEAARTDLDHRTILHRELALFQPAQSVAYYVSRLMEGSGNARLAAMGARMLTALAQGEDLKALAQARAAGDALTQKLALRVIGTLRDPVAAEHLLEALDLQRREYLETQLTQDLVRRLGALPRASARVEVVRHLVLHFEARDRATLHAVQQRVNQEGADVTPPLEVLRTQARGTFEPVLLTVATLLLEGKVARYTALLSETLTETDQRQAQLLEASDQIAEILAFQVECGELDRERVLPTLADLFRDRAGGDGFIFAYLRLLPADREQALQELLQDPDHERRMRYLDALGVREDDAFTPFFLRALNDPIVEVGQRAMRHLGKLPGSFPALIGMFETGQTDQVRMAIHVFEENNTRLAAEPLLAFLQKDVRDPLLVEAVEAIGSIRYPAGAPVLLEMLHDGKPLNLQVALASALGKLGTPEASLGLIEKAPLLKQAKVLILALEGALAAFPGFERPLPLDHLPGFLQLMDRCCDEREGEGQRLRAVFAAQDLYVFDRAAYERLKERFSDFLFDMRTKEAWDRESNDRVTAVVKELGRRSESLGLLARKETAIQGHIQHLPPTGPKRVEGLLALKETLSDPELIFRPEIAGQLAVLVEAELRRDAGAWRETALLCEIGGMSRRTELANPIRDIYQRATGLGLKSAARQALLNLGLGEADLNRRAPILSVLVLEPSAFFRKRLMSTLAANGHYHLSEAGSRTEAEGLLAWQPVDLVITESQDPAGDLAPWIEAQWGEGRCRYVIVSASSRDLGGLANASWVIGTLFKPYPMEQLIHSLES